MRPGSLPTSILCGRSERLVWRVARIRSEPTNESRIAYGRRQPSHSSRSSPLLRPRQFLHWLRPAVDAPPNYAGPCAPQGCPGTSPGIDWVIVGGESGPGVRDRCYPTWVRSIRDQCQDAGVPFFFKQWGGIHKAKAGRTLDGREWTKCRGPRRGANMLKEIAIRVICLAHFIAGLVLFLLAPPPSPYERDANLSPLTVEDDA